MNTTTAQECPFCDIVQNQPEKLVYDGDLLVAFRDAYPVNEGHTLIIPKKHETTTAGLPESWSAELLPAINAVREQIDMQHSPDGYNIGMNFGTAAGQTIDHLHWHLIPRYEDDVEDPEGGIRGVIPGEKKY